MQRIELTNFMGPLHCPYCGQLVIRMDLDIDEEPIIAPCPHDGVCPMAGGPSWCHFVERLSRTRTHRLLKHGDLGYEDEKFCYLVAARALPTTRLARIVKNPVVTKGFVKLDVCGADGLGEEKIARQDARYREAKKSSWGDLVPRE